MTIKRLFFGLLIQTLLWSSAWADDERFVLATTPISPSESDVFADKLRGIVRALFEQQGIEVRIVELPVRRLRRFAEGGQFDGIFPATFDGVGSMSTLLPVMEPLWQAEFVAGYVNEGVVIRSWSDLSTYRVAYPLGWAIIENQVSYDDGWVAMPNLEKLTRVLREGRVDAILHVRRMLEEHNQMHQQPKPVLLSQTLAIVDTHIFLQKRHAAIVPPLHAGLRQMKATGRFNTLCGGCLPDRTGEEHVGQ